MWKYLKCIGIRLKDKFGFKIYIFIAIVVYLIVYSMLQIKIYHSFHFHTWDLGVFNQAFWTTLNGHLFYYTSEPFYTNTGCFLGTHFGPVLLLILPLYAIYPSPETLLVISTAIIALGAIPAYEIAQLLVKEEKTAAILGLTYLLYLPLTGITLSGFSLESIAVTLFLFVILYLLKGAFKKLSLAVILGLATHEVSASVMVLIGLYGMWHSKSPRNRGFQASLIISMASILYLIFAQNMRVFLGWTQRPSLWNEWSLIGAESALDLPLKIFTNPLVAWNSLTFDWLLKTQFLFVLFAPFAFLPLLGLEGLLPAAPYLGASLFSNYGVYYSIENHYGAFTAPFFFVAMIHGIVRLQKDVRFRVSASRLAKMSLLWSVALIILFFPATYNSYGGALQSGEHERVIYNAMAQIPQDASVLTQNNIFPHLSSRIEAYTIPSPLWAEEYRQVGKAILYDLSGIKIQYVLVDRNSEPYSAAGGDLILREFIFKNQNYELIMEEDGVMLFELGE